MDKATQTAETAQVSESVRGIENVKNSAVSKKERKNAAVSKKERIVFVVKRF